MFSYFSSLPKLFKYFFSGVLMGIGFVLPVLWVTVFVGIALLLFLLKQETSWSKMVIGGIISFTTKTMFATSVFWSVYPITWIELNLGKWELLVIGFYWLTVSLFIGLGGGVLAGIFWLIRKIPTAFLILIFPAIFIAGEVMGSFIFSVLTYGEGGTFNFVYSLGYVGYLLAEHDTFIQLAVWGGVYFLSFVTVFLGGLVWFVYSERSRKNFFYLMIPTLLLFSVTTDFSVGNKNNYEYNPGGKIVAVVDTDFGGDYYQLPDNEEYKFNLINEAVSKTLEIKPDYIILPEGAGYNPFNHTPTSAYRLFRFQNSDPEVVLIDTSQALIQNEINVVRANIYDGINKTGWGADKQYLTPQGEFLPYLYETTLKFLKKDKALEELRRKLIFRPGPLSNQQDFPDIIPAVLFCFEGLDPYGVRRVVSGREVVPFVVHPISHAWFHQSEILWHQLDTMLKIQAIWNRVSIISAGNMVDGFLYTPSGEKVLPEKVLEGERWRVGIISL